MCKTSVLRAREREWFKMIGGDGRTSPRELSSSAKSRGCPEVLVLVTGPASGVETGN